MVEIHFLVEEHNIFAPGLHTLAIWAAFICFLLGILSLVPNVLLRGTVRVSRPATAPSEQLLGSFFLLIGIAELMHFCNKPESKEIIA